jgi:glutaryl-CoA dehydrogenase (non-decarboxylating)
MNFDLTEEQLEMKKLARDFAEKEIAPIIEKDEKEHRFRPEIVKKMAGLGFFGGIIPEKYGGMATGFLSSLIMNEEIARVSASYGLPFNMQMFGPANTIVTYGTEEQKQKYVPALVNADMMGAFAITEPNSGSDVVSMKSTAVEKDDHYVINGQKTWISNAQVADVALLYCHTDRDKKHKGMSCFLIEPKKMAGISTRPIETKLGLHCAPTGEVILEDAKVPKSAMLGQRGDGFKICMGMLDNTRLACRAVGVGQACVDASIKYACEREQFGQRIADFQIIQEQIAEMAVDVEAARLLVYRAAYLKDKGSPRTTAEVSMAKYNAAEVAVRNSGTAVKIFGSYGFSSEYPAERFFRDAKSFQIVEGTSNIQKMQGR